VCESKTQPAVRLSSLLVRPKTGYLFVNTLSRKGFPAVPGSPPAFRIPPLTSFVGLRLRGFFAFTVFGFADIWFTPLVQLSSLGRSLCLVKSDSAI
jgi:hypothetical protein